MKRLYGHSLKIKLIIILTLLGFTNFQPFIFGAGKYLYNPSGQANIIYLSPVPGAVYINPRTNIIVRSAERINESTIQALSLITAVGSQSGLHSGRIILTEDQKTLLFHPNVPFSSGEKVTVKVARGITTLNGNALQDTAFSFTISSSSFSAEFINQAILKEITEISEGSNGSASTPPNKTKTLNKVNGIKDLPDDFPEASVTQYNNPDPGYIFLSNFSIQPSNAYGDYLMILDKSGNPVFYRRMPAPCFDFKVQPTGLITYYNSGTHKFYGMNSSFAIVDSFACGNGYVTDLHELRVLPNGNYFLLADDYEKVDMSGIVPGGNPDATVTGIIIQELDKSGNVIFQWRSWDHFKITDATYEDLTAATIDYVHSNAIEIESDSTAILLSSRHLDEITKIDLNTGNIIWRLGGKNNQFQFVNDDIGFSHQHAIRRLPNGDIILFDDGNYHSPRFSRGVEYSLDEINKTATLVWQYRNNPDIYGDAMGNVERFENGNSLIGWGATNPTVTEVTPDGTIALELTLPYGQWSYRAFKLPLIFLYAPKGGENWRADTLHTITWTSSGVKSVNIDYSLNDGLSWQNIVSNYPADSGSYSWNVPSISSTKCLIRITIASRSAGNATDANFPYFAKSDSDFSIDSSLNVELSSFSSNVESSTVQLNWTTELEKDNYGFEIDRKMGVESWQDIGFIPSQGTAPANYSFSDKLDTTSFVGSIFYRLKQIDMSGTAQYLKEVKLNINLVPQAYYLFDNYPNPFNPTTEIKYSLPADSKVEIQIYNILGVMVKEIVNTTQTAGDHKAAFNGIGLPSGVYFYALRAKSLDGKQSAFIVKKMMLLK